MFTVYAIHAPEAAKLEAVKAEMIVMGAPTIEVIDCGDHYMAVEGSHRLAAAHALGLTPELTIRDQDDMLDISIYGTGYLAGEVAGELYSPQQAVAYGYES